MDESEGRDDFAVLMVQVVGGGGEEFDDAAIDPVGLRD